VIGAYRRPGLPTSATRELGGAARRTRVVRIGLAVCASALLVTAFLASDRVEARPTSYFATGGGGVVVLDLSTSVDPRKGQRVFRVLRSLSETSTRLGLVVFSDVAYEMFPPGTRGDQLRPLLPFFEPPRQSFVGRQDGLPRSFGPASPWTATFRGGTRISTGLREARRVIDRDGVRPEVMLISDLDDSTLDTEQMIRELLRYEADGIDLRVVPLFPPPEDRDLFERLVGEEAFVQNEELLRNTAIEERQSLVGSFPVAVSLSAACLLGLLALNERLCGRLAWSRA
jgi:hypothetical protein